MLKRVLCNCIVLRKLGTDAIIKRQFRLNTLRACYVRVTNILMFIYCCTVIFNSNNLSLSSIEPSLMTSSSSASVQGSVLLPHYRTMEARPGRIS